MGQGGPGPAKMRAGRSGAGRQGRPSRGAAGAPRARRVFAAALDAAPDFLLHPRTPDERVWKLLWPVLALAFAVRAAVALSGDFVLHPDEIMQYLEQGHRAAFGNGVIYWEFFYGARPWLIPGLIAGALKLFDVVGLGQPAWYVGGIKLMFCAISLAVPAGMYFFARRHFDEAAARAALLAGAFWYELAGFAHKPLTEFVATSALMALLALCVQPLRNRPGVAWLAALLAVLAAAIRMQYAPLALGLLGLCFLRAGPGAAPGKGVTRGTAQTTAGLVGPPGGAAENRVSETADATAGSRSGGWGTRAHLALAAVACFFAVGVFDAVTWGAGPFHSYLTNFRFNAALSEVSGAADSPVHQYLRWLAVAGAGLSALCAAAALRDLRRYGLLLALIALVLVPHTALAHKEYRLVFAVIPLWLLVGADVVARLAARVGRAAPSVSRGGAGGRYRGVQSAPDGRRAAPSAPRGGAGRRAVRVYCAAGAVFAGISLAGILNALPWQHELYEGAYAPRGPAVRFIGGLDPVFDAYRYLAEAPGVEAVWHVDRPYYDLPGYYYLHRKIPFYDLAAGSANRLHEDLRTVRASVSHVVSDDPGVSVPGYALEQEFGGVRILRREAGEPPIRRWRGFTPTVTAEIDRRLMRQIDPDAPSPPADLGIRFAAPE